MRLLDFPLAVFVLSLATLWLSTSLGAWLKRRRNLPQESREDYSLVQSATLTLLALIIGFTFSMAGSRYDQRKNREEAEANAIGTEFVRADLLREPDAAKLRELLRLYLDQRILFYVGRDAARRPLIDSHTARLQSELWAAVVTPTAAQPDALGALVVAGMNEVLNTQGYAQAAWRNRIPVAAWLLLCVIAICCNLSVGYGARNLRAERLLLWVLPFVLSVAFCIIADMDSPEGGGVRVPAQNLIALSATLRPR